MAKLKRCQKTVIGKNGKKEKCGIPLDVTGQCPTHGVPHD